MALTAPKSHAGSVSDASVPDLNSTSTTALGGISVLHVLDHSLPLHSGYSFRSHSLLTALSGHGVKVEALTSPKQGPVTLALEDIGPVRYLRTPWDEKHAEGGLAEQIRTVLSTRAQLRKRVRDGEISLLHAHSPCLMGLAAFAQQVPMIYEMRSSWEDAAVSMGTTSAGSVRYRLSRALETAVARMAEAVFVICEGLKQDLVARGIAEEKITIIPNAVSPEMFEVCDSEGSDAVRTRFGLHGKRVIGFFGSFYEWEGVDQLIRAMPGILGARPDVRLLLAGGGRQEQELRRLAESLGLGESVIFAGRVDAETVRKLYGAADVMVYPRIAHRLTEMVTPLKPLEAMAQRTPVVASDVGGHRELIEDGRTGFLFPCGDADALVSKVSEVLRTGPRIEEITAAARQFVERERRWSVVAERYLPVYEKVLAASARKNRPVASGAASG